MMITIEVYIDNSLNSFIYLQNLSLCILCSSIYLHLFKTYLSFSGNAALHNQVSSNMVSNQTKNYQKAIQQLNDRIFV